MFTIKSKSGPDRCIEPTLLEWAVVSIFIVGLTILLIMAFNGAFTWSFPSQGTLGGPSLYEHATDSKALAPGWFKESTRPKPLIGWLPLTESSPLTRTLALTLALLIIYFIAMCVATFPGALPNPRQDLDPVAWAIQCVIRFVALFLLLPVVLTGISFAFYWLLLLLCVAFAGEEYYVPAHFTAFITVVLAMLSLILVRFTPLVKLITSRKFILVHLGVLGVVLEVCGVAFTIRDIVQSIMGVFQ